MKQTEKMCTEEKYSVKEARKILTENFRQIQTTYDKVTEWMETNEIVLDNLLKNRQYDKAIKLLQKAPSVVGAALYLGDDIEGYLYDASDYAKEREPVIVCSTCGK